MRITFLGHAGLFIETAAGTVLCDPWFNPAYFGVVVPVPQQRGHRPAGDWEPGLPVRLAPAPRPLRPRLPRRARVQGRDGGAAGLPGRPARARAEGARVPPLREDPQRRAAGARRPAVRRCMALVSPSDGPIGDSALVVDDGTARILNQNDARPGDLEPIRALGPYDAQLLQYSGAIWFPIVYDFPHAEKDALGRRQAQRRDGPGPALRRGGRRRPRVPLRWTAVLPRRRAVPTSTTSTATPPTSSPTSPCSSRHRRARH